MEQCQQNDIAPFFLITLEAVMNVGIYFKQVLYICKKKYK